MGHYSAAFQAGPWVAAARLAHLRALRHGGTRPGRGRTLPGARRIHPGRARLGRDRVRRLSSATERRYRPNQCQPRGAADRRRTCAGCDYCGPLAPQRGAPGRLGGIRGLARRCRPCRWREGRRRNYRRRWPGACVAAAADHIHRGAGPPAARPRPGRGDRRTVPGGGPRRASRRCGRRRHAGRPSSLGTLLATAGLAVGGTLAPFTLFAYGQARVPAEVAGAFLNLEPLADAVAGVVFFADPAGPQQVTGFAAILAGIALGSLPLLGNHRRGTAPPFAPSRLCAGAVLEPGILVRSEIAAELPRLPPA